MADPAWMSAPVATPTATATPPGWQDAPLAKGDRAVPSNGFDQAHSSPDQSGHGMLLPLSWDQTGRRYFDPHAGLLGALLDAVTLPSDVYAGRVNPSDPSTFPREMNFAGFANPISPASRASAAMIQPKVPAPTADQLYTAADNAYAKARGLGVLYTSKSVVDSAAATQAAMEADGMLAENAPLTYSILKKLQSPPDDPTGAAPYTGIEAARQSLSRIARDNRGKTEAAAAQRVIAGLDGFLENPGPQAVVSGPAAAISDIAREARGNYAAASRSDKLTGIEDAAGLRTFKTGNTSDAIRGRVATLLLNPKQLAGFSPDEIAALRQVNAGTASVQTLDKVGRLVGLAATAGGAALGDHLAGGEGAAVGATIGAMTSPGARAASNWLTARALAGVDDAVRTRSPLYAQNVFGAPLSPATPAARQASASAASAFINNEMNAIRSRGNQQPLVDALVGPPTGTGYHYDANGRLVDAFGNPAA